MKNAIAALRSGAFLTAGRVRAYALTLIASYLLAIIAIVATGKGNMDLLNRPIGTDFSEVWAAGRSVLEGHPDAPFDFARHAAAQRALFGGTDTPLYGWHYPPYFLVLAALLARLPYLPALFVWQGTTLVLYLAIIRKIQPHRYTVLLALAFPAVFVTLTHGQNAFLTASLLGGGLLVLRSRPVLSGVLFALLAYKPQFALVVPVFLLVGQCWTTIASACVTLVLLTAATLAAFGAAPWEAFVQNLAFSRKVVLESGATGWEKIQSAFSAIRMWNGSVEAAYAVQGGVSVLVIAGLAWAWSRRCDPRLKCALVPVACLLVTPYSLDYDMVILAPAIAFFVSYRLERERMAWEEMVLTVAWAAPLVARTLGAIGIPFGLAAMSALFITLLRRVTRDGAMHGPCPPGDSNPHANGCGF